MKRFCKQCVLGEEIRSHKKRLDNMILIRNYSLLTGEVLEYSQKIDKLINQCIACNNWSL